jgi:AcrR family transcriptional regulator
VKSEAKPRQRNPRGQGTLLRDDLIDAATRLIVDRGDASGLSLRQVAVEAGVATTSIYAHFDNLDSLLQAVSLRGLLAFSASRDRAVEGAATPLDALLAGCVAYVLFAVANPGVYRWTFSAGPRRTMAVWGSPTSQDAPDGSAAYVGLVASITRCQASGQANSADTPDFLAALVWPALHGIAMLRIDRPGLPLPDIVALVHGSVRRLIAVA